MNRLFSDTLKHQKLFFFAAAAVALTFVVGACVAKKQNRPKIVGSQELMDNEEDVSVQLLSAGKCTDGMRSIYQCSGLRIDEMAFVSAGHCYKPDRSYFLLSSYKQMLDIRSLGNEATDIDFQKAVKCEHLDDYLDSGIKAEILVEITKEQIFVSKDYIDRIAQKVASPAKMASDFAVVKTDSKVLKKYPKFGTIKANKIAAESDVRFYGTGLDNCFTMTADGIKKIRSSKIDQARKTMSVGRADAVAIGQGEVDFVLKTEYSDSDKQRQFFANEADYLVGLKFLRNKVDNFPCGGDSGSGYLFKPKDEDEYKAFAIHRASVYDHVEVPYSIGVRLDSKWSCERFAEAGLDIAACKPEQ